MYGIAQYLFFETLEVMLVSKAKPPYDRLIWRAVAFFIVMLGCWFLDADRLDRLRGRSLTDEQLQSPADERIINPDFAHKTPNLRE